MILTLNAGSSSLKFAAFTEALERVQSGEVEEIGPHARLISGGEERVALEAADHAGAMQAILGLLGETPVRVVAHRIVHGGPDFVAPVELDGPAVAALADLTPFAPLHQPHNLAGVAAARAAFQGATQVGAFDTAFHAGQDARERDYALPRELREAGVRRYGFHGLSYDFVSREAARIAPEARRMVIAHLGNGASMCAVMDGRSRASTMGFTALDGLTMGTRCGQIDPGVLLWMMERRGMDVKAISDLLYRRSGLLGLSGLSSDMRVLEASGTPEAEAAIAQFVHRVVREAGALAAVLSGIDAFVFTGGIGENSVRIRAEVSAGLAWMGAALDPARNAAGEVELSARGSRLRLLRIPTDEEMTLARAGAAFLRE